MIYTLNFTGKAIKQISKLELSIKERVLAGLDRIKLRPHHFLEKLAGSKYYKLRIGDYRVIIDLQNDKVVILVIEIGHRKNIYK